MIHATFLQDEDGKFLSYSVTGHAQSGRYGQDIICAAVSALTISNVNYLEKIRYIDAVDCYADEENGGELHVELSKELPNDEKNIRQILVEQLYYGLIDIAQESSEYLVVKLNNK